MSNSSYKLSPEFSTSSLYREAVLARYSIVDRSEKVGAILGAKIPAVAESSTPTVSSAEISDSGVNPVNTTPVADMAITETVIAQHQQADAHEKALAELRQAVDRSYQ